MKKVVCIENITFKRKLSLYREYEVLNIASFLYNSVEYTFYQIVNNKNKKQWVPSNFFDDLDGL